VQAPLRRRAVGVCYCTFMRCVTSLERWGAESVSAASVSTHPPCLLPCARHGPRTSRARTPRNPPPGFSRATHVQSSVRGYWRFGRLCVHWQSLPKSEKNAFPEKKGMRTLTGCHTDDASKEMEGNLALFTVRGPVD
jgi:hypothetical protein